MLLFPAKTPRATLQSQLFPLGIPTLWCPSLSYFSAAECFDARRIEQHLQRLAPHVRGLLVPGSTGEGWEMNDAQIRELLEIVLPIADELEMHVLIGILKTQTADMLYAIDQLQTQIQSPASVGITVCPAQGAELSQSSLVAGLTTVLELGLPTAVYQLPQVTQNELEASSVKQLADAHTNFILFKDTSGEDRVANSGVDLGGVFMVRGAERGGYSYWLKSVGGPYDGFLLSTANSFAPQLAEICQACHDGQSEQAQQLSAHVEQLVSQAFSLVQEFSTGNAFTNANKLIDHLLIHGSNYRQVPSPMLISGVRLPLELVEAMAPAILDLD